jgi:hypothetical protein
MHNVGHSVGWLEVIACDKLNNHAETQANIKAKGEAFTLIVTNLYMYSLISNPLSCDF